MKRLAAIAAYKLSVYLRSRVNEEYFKNYSRLISRDITDEDIDNISESPDELFFDNAAAAARYRKFYELLKGDAIAMTAVQLYVMATMDERTLDILRNGVCVSGGLTIEAAAKIAYPDNEIVELLPQLRRAFEKVELLLQADPEKEPLKAPFRIDWRLVSWLSGDDKPDEKINCTLDDHMTRLPAPILTEKNILPASNMIGDGKKFCFIHILGEQKSGRRHFARFVSRLTDRQLMMVPFSAVGEDGVLNPIAWRRVLRELLLGNRLLCLHDITCPDKERANRLPELMRQLEKDLARFNRPVFITTGKEIKAVPFVGQPIYTVSVPEATISQSAALWREFAEQMPGKNKFPAENLAAKMTLTPGQMQSVVRLLQFQNTDGPWEEREIFKLCYQVLDDGRYENIRFVDTAYTWNDLQLEEQLKSSLQAVCAQVEHQGLVLDEWGLRRRYPYGRCVSVLMSGPPGTGKSMTAQVLASKLGLELYKVDLSQIVDKYIGETEKRLRQVFDQAEKSNMVLFFDEADALLGKRSEIKDSKDKYANTEVAYLLQRMEEYHGIVLMATNQAGNMDSAFIRRFRYHLVFTLPDAAMRRNLWENALEGIPAQGIQLDYLAEQFELSGAQIKNIALNAAYRAADDGKLLTMRHLVIAIYREFKKEGKVMLASEFGGYGIMLSDHLSGGQY